MEISAESAVSIFTVLLLVASALWVYQDALAHAERGAPVVFSAGSIELSTPAVWAAACLCLWVLCTPLYLTCRKQAR